MSDDPRWTRRMTRVPNLIVLGIVGLLVGNENWFPAWLRGLGILVWIVCFIWQIRIEVGNWWTNRH